EHGMFAAQRGQARDVVGQVLVVAGAIPVHPGDLVVLAIAVVVATLCPAELIAVQQHRHALCEEKGREEVALLLFAERDDPGIVRLALGAAVPRPVVALAVVVLLSVGVVVLFVVADEVMPRDAAVCG